VSRAHASRAQALLAHHHQPPDVGQRAVRAGWVRAMRLLHPVRTGAQAAGNPLLRAAARRRGVVPAALLERAQVEGARRVCAQHGRRVHGRAGAAGAREGHAGECFAWSAESGLRARARVRALATRPAGYLVGG